MKKRHQRPVLEYPRRSHYHWADAYNDALVEYEWNRHKLKRETFHVLEKPCNVSLSPERPHKARLPRKQKKKLRRQYRYFTYERYCNEYACPRCGWEPFCFEGVYYRVDKKRRRAVIDVYAVDWVKQEFGHDKPVYNKPLGPHHWPKFTHTGYGHEGGQYWYEEYQCCKCLTIFGWDNSSH